MMNTLGLDDDLDTIEVVSNLETSFSVRLTDAEVSAWRTVGDIYSTLRSRVSNSGKRGGRCATATTFHRLRRARSRVRRRAWGLGDLSRKVTGLNFGKLSDEGAELHDRDLWNALVEVLSEDSLLPKLEIRPETLLLQKQIRSA